MKASSFHLLANAADLHFQSIRNTIPELLEVRRSNRLEAAFLSLSALWASLFRLLSEFWASSRLRMEFP